MLYTSERNYGCRFLEVALFGYRAVILENDKIRVTLLLDKGTEIIEFNHKASDTDFVWRSPLGLSCLRKIEFAKKDEQILTDGYTGGWFECFPNVGTECRYRGAIMPQYGEVCYLPWEYTVMKDEPDEVILKCFVRTTKTPYHIEKTFSLKSGAATLFIDESITNTSPMDLEYQWGFHPNFGANLIDESCEIDMKGGGVKGVTSGDDSRFTDSAEGEWPYIKAKDGTVLDLRKVLPPGAGICEVTDIYDLKEGFTSVKNRRKNLGMEMRWDIKTFKHNVIWHVSNGERKYPRYGNTYVLGFVPRNDKTWGLEQSAALGGCPVIAAGKTKKAWFTIDAVTYS